MATKIEVTTIFQDNGRVILECDIADLPILFGAKVTESQVRLIIKEELSKIIKYSSAVPENTKVPTPHLTNQ